MIPVRTALTPAELTSPRARLRSECQTALLQGRNVALGAQPDAFGRNRRRGTRHHCL